MFKSDNTKVNVNVLERCVPSIIISPDAITKMQIYVDECADEIGWLGTAYKNKNIIYINDVFLFDQEVHSTTTEISPEGLSEFAETLLKQDNGMDIWNNLKVWGHSHVDMGTSPSKQDEEQMETFINGGHDWFMRIIANKKDSLRVDLYDYTVGVIYNNLPWQEHITEKEIEIERQIQALYLELDKFQEEKLNKFKDDVEKEIKIKVKKKTFTNTHYHNYHHGWQDTDIPAWQKASGKKKPESTTLDAYEIIGSIEDVYTHFEQEVLLDVGECADIVEVKDILRIWGSYYNSYTDEELKLILAASKEMVCEIYYTIDTPEEHGEVK